MYSIVKGSILKVNNDKRTVQVQTSESTEPFNVKLHQIIGSAFIPLIKNSSLCYVFKINGSKSNAFCIPFDILEQEVNLEFGENGDFVQGNIYSGCKITYKVNGDIEVQATGENQQISINGKTISINGESIAINGSNEINLNSEVCNIENQTTNINSSAMVNINGSMVNIADAIALALNQNAQMQVVIPSGSSAGTYPVQIMNAGQVKVKI
jgi:hypothetical protein